MARTNWLQSNFTAGELSKELIGRVDIAKYFNGAETLENIILKAYGGAKGRPGTYYVGSVKTSTAKTRLIPFEFSTSQAYVLELGNKYMRIYKDGGQMVYETLTINAQPVAGDWSVGDVITGGTSEETCIIVAVVSSTVYTIKHRTGDFTLDEILTADDANAINCTAAFPTVANSATVVDITTPWATADLFELQFAQDADTMYVVHNNYPPYKITRTAHDNWACTEIDFTVEPLRAPLMDANSDPTILITASADDEAAITLDTNGTGEIFTEDHIGSIWKINAGYVEIKTWVDAEEVTADVLYGGDLDTSAVATAVWAEAAWSDERGYPSCACFYEERFYTAASIDEPQAFWGSYIGEYENFAEGATASDAVRYVIASQKVNVIQWMLSSRVLALGTSGGVFIVSSGTANEPISPSNVQVKPEASYGSALILPQRIGHYVYYMQRNLRTVRELSFDYASDSYVSLDMTLLANHITKSGITQMDYQESPDNILWCVRDDGEIATMTRQIDQQVIGWSRQILGGSFGGGNAVVESIAIIPNGAEDQVWMIVKRTIGTATTRYIEYMTPVTLPDEQEDAFFVDAGLSLDVPIVISDISSADPAVVTTSAAHGLSDGDRVRITNVKGTTEVNQNYYIVANENGSDTFELTDINGNDIDSQDFEDYISGGEVRLCVNSVSGLTYLNGQVVAVACDGAAHPNRTVSGGSITLDGYYARIHVGLPYTPKIKSLILEPGSPIGSGQGLSAKITRITAKLYRTLGCKIGYKDNYDTVIFRDNSFLNKAPILFSGNKQITFPSQRGRGVQWEIIQEQPLPFHVLSVTSYMEMGDY